MRKKNLNFNNKNSFTAIFLFLLSGGMFLPNLLSFRACIGQYSGYYIGDSSGLQSYSGGDGLDEEALAWNNIAFQDLYY